MSMKPRKHLIETIIDKENDLTFQFEATFGFLEALKARNVDANYAFTVLSQEITDPSLIKNILASSVTKENGKEIDEARKEEIAVEIIERFGLMEAYVLSVEMLTRSIRGDIKKSQAAKKEMVKNLIDQIYPNSHWTALWKVGLFVAVMSMIFGPLGWLIFRYFATLIW